MRKTVRNVMVASGRLLSAKSMLDMFRKRLEAESIGRKFELSNKQLLDLACRMKVAMNASLRSANSLSSTVKCWDTHVDFPLPKPADQLTVHRYLSVELTHSRYFRVRLTHVSDTGSVLRESSTYPLPEYLKTGTVRRLFDYVADRLVTFTNWQRVRVAGLPVAFTFGFPVRQIAPDAAILQRWTKELACTNAVGKDVVNELRSSLRRANVAVGPVVLFNDACALLLNNQFADADQSARVSVVVNDGCNCCYTERVENVRNRFLRHRPFWSEREPKKTTASHTVVNTEWGSFGDDGMLDEITTELDKRVDQRSLCPGKQIFEKMTSGKCARTHTYARVRSNVVKYVRWYAVPYLLTRSANGASARPRVIVNCPGVTTSCVPRPGLYMGELVRKMVLEMTSRKLMFGGRFTSAMLTMYALKPEYLCVAESDARTSFDGCRTVLTQALGVANPSTFDCSLFRYACECVTKRSAHLVSAGLTGVIRRLQAADLDDDAIVRVSVGGFVFHKHPKYYAMVGCKTRELANATVSLQSGDYKRGAPLVAGILARMSAQS